MSLRGHFDFASHHGVSGWALDTGSPEVPVSLVVSINDTVVGRVLADLHRPDLAHAGIGTGRHGFELRLKALSPLARHAISIRREGDGAHLYRSPRVLEPATAFDQTTKDAIAQIMSTVGGPDDLDARLDFLLDQVERLRQLKSHMDSGAIARAEQRARMWGERSITDTRDAAAATARATRRALILCDRLPLADHDSASNALTSHIHALRRLGFTVVVAPVGLDGDPSRLAASGVTCCLRPWYSSIEDVLRLQRDAFQLVVMHRVATAGRYAALVRDHQPWARLVFIVGDLLHLQQARQAEIEQRPELAALSERTRLLEAMAARQSDAVITHSTAEVAALRRIVHPDAIHVVPWSVPARPTPVPFAARDGLAFIGAYEKQANVDAATWLVDAILPALRATGCHVRTLLAGSDMPEHLKTLRHPGVAVLGQVADLGKVFDRVRLTVAPVAFGAGVKGKVLDSMAAGVPCVCTPAAAEGLELPEALTALVADTPAGLARSIRALHEDEALNVACTEAGLAYIRERADEAHADARLRAAVDP